MSDLRNRAHGREVDKVEKTDAELQEQAVRDAQSNIRRMEEQFSMAMPKGIEAHRLIRDAQTLVRQTPKLALCNGQTLLGGLMTFAQLGLRPGVLGHGWLLPFWDRQGSEYKAQIVIGYRGYIDLGYRSGEIARLAARTVFANDEFRVDFGTQDELIHRPVMTERGDPIAYYAVGKVKGGDPMFVLKSHPDMEAWRDRYAMAQRNGKIIPGTPWADHFEGMAHKTMLRQLYKWLPQSTDLAAAMSVDEGFRADLQGRPEESTFHIEQVPASDAGGNEQEGTKDE